MNEIKVGDKIDVGDGYITNVIKIEYCPYAKMKLYFFYNIEGEYKYNIREYIKKM